MLQRCVVVVVEQMALVCAGHRAGEPCRSLGVEELNQCLDGWCQPSCWVSTKGWRSGQSLEAA